MFPSLGDLPDLNHLLNVVEGILLTGSHSNIDPLNYGVNYRATEAEMDLLRDQTTLTLIPEAIKKGVPILCICRGFQEMNVAFGGSLHQQVHRFPGFCDHRSQKNQPLDSQYKLTHSVRLQSGSFLKKITGIHCHMVNSLHEQGIDRLGTGLEVEAVAHDGLIEAFRIQNSEQFALGVQWHPELKFWDNDFYSVIFYEFGIACRKQILSKEEK